MRKHNPARFYGTGTHRRGSSAPFGEPLKLADRSEGSRYQALPALMMAVQTKGVTLPAEKRGQQ